jgi:hypothetical protein
MTRTGVWLMAMLGAGAAGIGLTAQNAARPAAPAQTTPRPAANATRIAPVGSIKELMDSLVDPAADVIFDSVSYDITTAGIVEKKPTKPEDWAEIRRHALLLAEVSNVLKMPGRKVAPDHPIAELETDEPAPEDLTPSEIQVLINDDPNKFYRLAQNLRDAALLALNAVDRKSVEDLFSSGDDLDRACESCHLQYWYPKDKKPLADALSRRKKR